MHCWTGCCPAGCWCAKYADSVTLQHFLIFLRFFFSSPSATFVCSVLLLLPATDLRRSLRIWLSFFFWKPLRRRIWKSIHWIGDAGGCFSYILLEPPRRRSHQSPLPGRCRVTSFPFHSLSPTNLYVATYWRPSATKMKWKRTVSVVCTLHSQNVLWPTFSSFLFLCLANSYLESKLCTCSCFTC